MSLIHNPYIKKINNLSIMAGLPICLKNDRHNPTYSLKYLASEDSDLLRNKLFISFRGGYEGDDDIFGGDAYKRMGEDYRAQGKGFFATHKKLDEEGIPLVLSYTLKSYAKNLENLTNLPFVTINNLYKAYGFTYIIHEYFDSVDEPKDGNLVVYQAEASFVDRSSKIACHEGDVLHAGVYREFELNSTSVTSGIVESRWSNLLTPYIFQHDPFFVPSFFGNVIKFYQPKANINKDAMELLVSAPKMYNIDGDHFHSFQATPENLDIRSKIDKLFKRDLINEFPEIKMLDHIDFTGVCYHYAFCKVFNTYNIPLNIHQLEGNTEIIKKYFTSTVTPEKGDLVVYYSYKSSIENAHPLHYGIFILDNLIESKWGQGDVYQHPAFYIPDIYGNYLKFYELNPGLTPESLVELLGQDNQVI